MSVGEGIYLFGFLVFAYLYSKSESSWNITGQIVGAILAALWPIAIIASIIYGNRKSRR